MTEITTPITPSTPSTNITTTDTTNTTNTTNIITSNNIPSDNVSGSEYQRSYAWRLPMKEVIKPRERKKSEYQREFTWKNDLPSTPSPAPSPVPIAPSPIAPSPIPQDSLISSTPEPTKPIITNIDSIGSKLSDLNLNNNTFISEPEDFVVEKFSTSTDKWKDGLRSKNSPEPRQSTLASSLDPRTKRIVALEANRLSKKSRSYSMYSLHDKLKVSETADELSCRFDTEYNREFVNWEEYGTTVREDIMITKKTQSTDHKLRRRGSWSAPAPISTSTPTSLPAPLKWLEDLNLDLAPRASSRDKLQPTIPDSKSIRGKSQSRSARDNRYDYYDEKRPTTSAEFRDYHHTDVRDYSRPMTSLHNYNDDDYYNSKNYSKRSSTTLGHYKDNGISSNGRKNYEYYDDRKYEERKYDDRKYEEKKYDDRKYEDKKYDDRRYDDRKYEDSRRYDDRKYEDSRRYDDKKYDDRRYEDRKYDDRKRENIYDDHKRENVYDDLKRENLYDDRKRDPLYNDRRRESTIYDDRRRENTIYDDNRRRDNAYDDRQRENSSYDHDYRRRENDYEYNNNNNNNRVLQTPDREHFNPGHSRNTSYASSSNKGSSVHDEPTGFSGPPLSYLDAMRHRSSVSSISSVSTPSSPATPTGYDINDSRWKKHNGLDPRIYKEYNYSPSIASKSSSSSNHKYWQFEDEKDKYNHHHHHHQGVLSPSKGKFFIDEEEDDEHLDGYSSSRHSRDYKSFNQRYSSQSSPSQTRSTSPSQRHYYRSSNYSSRPPSRATSVSSHATSIEEESAVLTDLLKEAELMTLKNLTDQMSIFKARDINVGQKGAKGVTNSGRATPNVAAAAAKRSSVSGQKKSTTNTTTKSTTKATTTKATTTKAGVKSKTVPQTTKTSTKSGITTKGTRNSSTPGIPPNKKKIQRPESSLSSISTTSYREAYQPPPTNFSAAREALNKARMKVEEMLEIVSNGGSLD